MKRIFDFAKDESGATAVEYGLIAALISVVCIGALGVIGTELNKSYNNVASALTSANATL